MGLKPERRLCVAQKWGEQSQRAAQLSPLHPSSGIEGSSSCRWAKKEKEKDGWGTKRKRKETLQVSMFHNITKIPRKPVEGRHTEEFRLSNGCGSLLKFMENSSFVPFGSGKPDPSEPPRWPRKGHLSQSQYLAPSPSLQVLLLLFPLTVAKRSSRSLKLIPKFGSELPGSPSKMRTGMSFMSHIAHHPKPTSSSENA